MQKLNKSSSLYLACIFVLLMAISFINHNYVINSMLFVCLVITMIIVNADTLYDKLYFTLIVSAIFEYSAYVLNIEKLYFFHVMLFIVAVLTLYKIIKKEINFSKINKAVLYFYSIWYAYIILSILWAKNKSLGVKYLAIYTMMFVFLGIIILYNSKKESFKNTIKVLGFMFIVSITVGLIESVGGYQLPIKHYYNFTVLKLSFREIAIVSKRPIAFFYNSNNFATFVSMFIAFPIISTFLSKDKKIKVISFIITIIGYTTLILTDSRSNFMATMLVFLICVILSIIKDKLKVIPYVLIFVLAFGVIYKYGYLIVSKRDVTNEVNISQRMKSLGRIVDKEIQISDTGSENERVTIMYDIYQGIFKEKKILGFGTGNTTQYLMDRKNTQGIYSPHGQPFELIGDFGIFIFAMYYIFELYLFYKIFRNSLKSNGFNTWIGFSLLGSLAGFTLGSLAPSSVTYFLPYWMLFGIAISFIQINKKGLEG